MAGKQINSIKSDKRTKEQQQADFLAALQEYASVSRACKRVKVSRTNVYYWLKHDPAFKVGFDEAAEVASFALEDEAIRRAYEGTNKPVYQKGELVGYIREYSDTLMIVLLKARMPEKYKDKSAMELGGMGGKPITVSALDGLTFEQLMKLKYGKDYDQYAQTEESTEE